MMFLPELCKVCSVPRSIARSLTWNSDGTITQRRDPDHRMIFIESDGLKVLFSNIEDLIGISIEKIVIESKSRSTGDFISKLVRGPKGAILRLIGVKRVINQVQKFGRSLGYGDTNVVSFDWSKSEIFFQTRNPYSLPMVCGDLRGATEAIRKISGTVEYEEVGPNTYRIHGYLAPLQTGIEERLIPPRIPRKPGDMEYRRCPKCDVPVELSEFQWNLEDGIIRHRDTGLRFAFIGPVGLQIICDELETEIGESIPEAIIEAQRLHSQSVVGDLWQGFLSDDFRKWLGVLGMGNLVSVELEGDLLSARIENSALPLMTVGTAIAIREHMTEGEVKAGWSLAGDGDLSFTVS